MLGVLKDIYCAIISLPAIIADWLVAIVNLFIAGIGALVDFVFWLLPAMPEPPEAPDSEVLQTLNWLFPVTELVAGFTVVVGLVLAMFALRIALNWAKALGS